MDKAAIFRSFGFAGHPALQAIGVANLFGRVPIRAAIVDAMAHAGNGTDDLVFYIHNLSPRHEGHQEFIEGAAKKLLPPHPNPLPYWGRGDK